MLESNTPRLMFWSNFGRSLLGGSYVILYGASAATADEWGRRYLKDVSCMSIAFQERPDGKHNSD